MSQPFRFLDLPAELQVVVLRFYFEAPFDIKIKRRWDWEFDDERYRRLPKIEDSRSIFPALWTSPKLYEQARQAYLQGFSCRLDVSELKVDCGEVQRSIYESLFRTLPMNRTREIELGLVIPTDCLETVVHEQHDEEEEVCENCEPDAFRMLPNLFDSFESLRTISISLGYDYGSPNHSDTCPCA